MVISSLEISLCISLLLSASALIIAIKSLLYSRLQLQQTDKLLQRLMRELSISKSGSVGMGQRLLSMEKRLQETSQSLPQNDHYNDEDFQPYSQAAQLFSLGIDSEEVARRCGLSRAEASLIQMMQLKVSHVN
jgi:hypothetical protein